MIGLSVSLRRRARRSSTPGQPDLLAPVIASLSIDEGTWQFGFGSDEAGALHWLIDNAPGYPNADALVAAKPLAAAGSGLALAGVNSGGVDVSGVASGSWRFHVGVIDATGNASNVLSANVTVVSGNLELNGDPLVWNGDQLIFNAA